MDQNTQTSQPRQPNTPGQQPGQGNQNHADQGDAQGQNASPPSREVSSSTGQRQRNQLARSESDRAVMPPVDIVEDETGFTVIADMPGVTKDQLNVRVNGDSLLIEGKALLPDIGNMELVYGEAQTPYYRRSFTLSRELDPGKIEAKLANGVLRLCIPKAEAAKPRRIEVSLG